MEPVPEVQYERLRPAQIAAARAACPVAYLPLGTLEWHGLHNPVGLDGLKSHALMVACARKIGGLVLPCLYYGENREQALMDANSGERGKIAAAMGLPAANFDPGYMMVAVSEQNRRYQMLLMHILHEVRSLGFRVVVISAGHYPLLDHARSAAALFHQEQPRPKLLAWAMCGYELVKGRFTPCGDHAGKWETSLLMHLDPGMQDLGALPTGPDAYYVGVSDNGVPDSNADFGAQAVAAIVSAVETRVRDLLANHDQYQGHGGPV